MSFTCDRCHGDYDARKESAVAHVYVRDSRCNHVEAQCTHCGTTEVIFLGPSRLEEVISTGDLRPEVHAEANAGLRVRAEKAWAAAEQASPSSATTTTTQVGGAPPTVEIPRLSRRQEDIVAAFGEALTNIPDDLLWDGMGSSHDESPPEHETE